MTSLKFERWEVFPGSGIYQVVREHDAASHVVMIGWEFDPEQTPCNLWETQCEAEQGTAVAGSSFSPLRGMARWERSDEMLSGAERAFFLTEKSRAPLKSAA